MKRALAGLLLSALLVCGGCAALQGFFDQPVNAAPTADGGQDVSAPLPGGGAVGVHLPPADAPVDVSAPLPGGGSVGATLPAPAAPVETVGDVAASQAGSVVGALTGNPLWGYLAGQLLAGLIGSRRSSKKAPQP